jgi:hypothetical protein
MHVMIGLLFGPVVWFALLMMALLVAGYLPEPWLAPVERLATWLEKRPVRTTEQVSRESPETDS